jgi:hypothetical protein
MYGIAHGIEGDAILPLSCPQRFLCPLTFFYFMPQFLVGYD